MKHEKEIEEFLRGLVYNETMSEDEYNQIVEETLKVMDITKQTLSDHLETGVVNGYSIEAQIKILRQIIVDGKASIF